MSTPVVILIGVVFIGLLVFAFWYMNAQTQRELASRKQGGLQTIFSGLGTAVSGIGGVIDL